MSTKTPKRMLEPSLKLHQALVALGIAITIAISSIGAFVIIRGRQAAWNEAQVSSENLMLAIQRDFSRNFQMLDLSLQGTLEALAEPDLASVSSGIFRHAVFDRAASIEYVDSFAVLDAQGFVIQHASTDPIAPESLADREYFKVHRADPDLGLYFSNVHRSRRGGRPVVGFSRRRNTPDGQFAGVVIGTISTDYFRRTFQNLDVGPHGSINVLTTSGRLVHRTPFQEDEIDRDLSDAPAVRNMLKVRQGQFVAHAKIDGVERLFTFGHVDGMPLIIAVNRSVEDIFVGWRTRALTSIAVLTVLCLATLSMTFLFYREACRRAAAERDLLASARQLLLMASTDGLTGLGNRRSLETTMDREWKRSIRSGMPLALLMIDVDYFKLYNDYKGHLEGDQVLKAVADCIGATIMRATDTVSRYGGEEFVALLSEIDAAGALTSAERVRAAVQDLNILHTASPGGFLTVSIGVSTAKPTLQDTASDLLKAADLALYKAKHGGRNRVAYTEFQPSETTYDRPGMLIAAQST